MLPDTFPQLDGIMRSAGAIAWGVAAAVPVDDEAWERRNRWIAGGCNAGMDYLDRYPDVRRDPRNLLEGARSIIVGAFSYYPSQRQHPSAPQFAWYAYGRDYHEVLRTRLQQAADTIAAMRPGATFRICVDTAPVMERYWAVKAGVGFIGRNAQLIVPGYGSACFLGEIVTDIPLTPSAPCTLACPDGCDLCIRACPGHALSQNLTAVRPPSGSTTDVAITESPRPYATVDARRCLSYLTIEHRGPLPEGAPHPGRRIYGCDTCQTVCPFNRHSQPTAIPEFAPSPALLSITDADIAALTPEAFSTLFRHSAIKRAKLAGLLRNLAAISKPPSEF